MKLRDHSDVNYSTGDVDKLLLGSFQFLFEHDGEASDEMGSLRFLFW